MKQRILAMAVAALLAMGALGMAACSNSSGSGSGSADSSSASSESSSSKSGTKSTKSEASESAESESAESASASAASASASSASASASSAAASSSAAAAKSDNVFVGTWDLVAMQFQGLTMAGDLSQFLGDDNLQMVINADGSGSLVSGGSSEPFNWIEKSSSEITLTDSIGDVYSVEYESNLGVIGMEFSNTGSDLDGAVIIFGNAQSKFSLPEVNFNDATKITDAKALLGTWKMAALNMSGVYMEGDIEGVVGGNISFEFKENGTVTMSAPDSTPTDLTYTSDSNGTIIAGQGGEMEVREMGGNLIIDFSDAMGAGSYILFSK